MENEVFGDVADAKKPKKDKSEEHDDSIFLLRFLMFISLMNVNPTKFPKKFDSRTILRELP